MLTIERFEPFREMVSLQDAVSSLFRDSYVRPPANGAAEGVGRLALDVVETENEFVVKASLPGVLPDDVQITVHGDTLTIRGELKPEPEQKGQTPLLRERRHGAFGRAVTLTAPVNSDAATADYRHGVLTLTLPKAEQAKPRQIKIGK